MNARPGLAFPRDKSPTSTISEEVPGALRRLNNPLGLNASWSAVCARVVIGARRAKPCLNQSDPLPKIGQQQDADQNDEGAH
jgi:hypothetical protein